MCYKNFAPLGLECKIHAGLQEFRPAGALIQNTYESTRILLHCGGLEYKMPYCSRLAVLPFSSGGATFL